MSQEMLLNRVVGDQTQERSSDRSEAAATGEGDTRRRLRRVYLPRALVSVRWKGTTDTVCVGRPLDRVRSN